MLGRQVLIHEQNAVLGRANRVLCALGAHLAISFGGSRYIKIDKTRTRKVGNPVRNDVPIRRAAATVTSMPRARLNC